MTRVSCHSRRRMSHLLSHRPKSRTFSADNCQGLLDNYVTSTYFSELLIRIHPIWGQLFQQRVQGQLHTLHAHQDLQVLVKSHKTIP